MKKTVEIIYTLDMRLIKPEQLEWISINKDDIEASCITIGEVVNVNIVLWESYRIDTGQCDQDNGLEYLIGEESIEYNIICNCNYNIRIRFIINKFIKIYSVI